MKSLFLPLAAFATISCLLLIGLAVGQHTQALPIDTTLDVCLPPILTSTQSIPKLPIQERTHTLSQPSSVIGGLEDQLALAGPLKFERRCGPNGWQLVRVPDHACRQAGQVPPQQPANTETRVRTNTRTFAVAKAVVSRVRVFQRIRARRG